MNSVERFTLAGTLTISLLVAGNAFSDDDRGLYFAVSGNRLSADFEDVNDVSFDDSDTAGGLRLGYMFDDFFGAEIGYIDLGQYSARGDTPGNDINLDAQAFTGALVLSWELAHQFDIYGKVGAIYVEADSDSTIAGNSFRASESGTEAFGAIGVEADFGAWNLFGELSKVNTDTSELDIDIATVGIKYEFGE